MREAIVPGLGQGTALGARKGPHNLRMQRYPGGKRKKCIFRVPFLINRERWEKKKS